MVHQFFSFSTTQERMHEGPLGCYVDDFAARLNEQGYSRQFAACQIRWAADFSRWLFKQGLSASNISQQIITRYLRYRKRRVRLRQGIQSALDRLLNLLREKGISRQEAFSVVKNARQKEEDRFKSYLLSERRLSPQTLPNYLCFIRQFLQERFGEGVLRLSNLRAEDITGYVQHHASSLSPGRRATSYDSVTFLLEISTPPRG